MTATLPILALMLLMHPDEATDLAAAAAISADADRVYEAARPEPEKTARIRSQRSDFDRTEGVAMFEGDVYVEYDRDYVLAADRLFVFAAGTNKLNRIVAVGHVSITNETRVGTCELAEFRRLTNEIEMFGDGKGSRARLADLGGTRDAVDGTRILFCLDSEQVEVDDAAIAVGSEKGGKLL